jgi:hypothetical protein
VVGGFPPSLFFFLLVFLFCFFLSAWLIAVDISLGEEEEWEEDPKGEEGRGLKLG